ncbi:uncharacterized protein DMENIID0001_023180 [Sergentomyia squamirostris]
MTSNEASDKALYKCPDFVMEVLGEIATKHGIHRPNFTFQGGSEAGDGFIGVVTRVVIVDEENTKELRLICKHLKQDPDENDIFTFMDMFQREIFIYRHVFPEFVALQREKNIPKDEGFFSFPTCHFAQQHDDEAALIFDDLCASGYRMLPKRQCPDFEHVRLLMIQLGRLHALSFALREQKPQILQSYHGLGDICTKFMRRKVMQPIAPKNCRLVQTILKPEETVLREYFKQWETTMWSEIAETIKGENAEPWAVITHGDCWINNFMYSYDDSQGNPMKITLIDWQTCCYGSPVLDIYYFLFTCTDKPFRDAHYHACLDIYYESLSKLLKQLGGDADKQFPRKVFEEHMKKFGKLGMAMATFTTPLDTEYVSGYDEKPEHTFFHSNKERYEVRMRGNITDFINFGFMH